MKSLSFSPTRFKTLCFMMDVQDCIMDLVIFQGTNEINPCELLDSFILANSLNKKREKCTCAINSLEMCFFSYFFKGTYPLKALGSVSITWSSGLTVGVMNPIGLVLFINVFIEVFTAYALKDVNLCADDGYLEAGLFSIDRSDCFGVMKMALLLLLFSTDLSVGLGVINAFRAAVLLGKWDELSFFSVRMDCEGVKEGVSNADCPSSSMKTNSFNSTAVILFYLSATNALEMNSLAIFPIPFLTRMSSMHSVSIFLMSSFSFLAFHGVSPVSISQKMMPNAQMSVLVEYQFLFNDYGAMYNGDPTLYLLNLPTSSTLTPKPKSAIFNTPPQMSRLAGLRSLWMTLA